MPVCPLSYPAGHTKNKKWKTAYGLSDLTIVFILQNSGRKNKSVEVLEKKTSMLYKCSNSVKKFKILKPAKY